MTTVAERGPIEPGQVTCLELAANRRISVSRMVRVRPYSRICAT